MTDTARVRTSAPARWLVRDTLFSASEPVHVGIINVTPDSFHDGGRHDDADSALRRAQELLADGAHIVDVGAESTRPGADDVASGDQLRRIGPLVAKLSAAGALVSIDTRNPEVAARALEDGAAVINDVSGLADPEMARVVASFGASLVIMHTKGNPKTMQKEPSYDDVVGEVSAFLEERLAHAIEAGVPPGKIAIDPGIGFGKRLRDNLDLLRNLGALARMAPVMIGVSRKSFLGALGAGEKPADRLAGSLAASVIAWRNGARIFRTHDVLETRRAIEVARALDPESAS
ncbi:MAG: dihydropteroate synthase [Candidatus Hydrogenedentota bacterium]